MVRNPVIFSNGLPRALFRFAGTIAIAVFLATAPARTAPAADGLYATFQTTHGSFTLELAFDKVPMTVANFVGLAEGSRAWVDFKTGLASNQPYFNGLKIPRAEAGFVIQMGSPSNNTSGGPGYQFGDELHPDLTHLSAGIASMANNGADTNGSQFFITLAATPFLDAKHSVFGAVVEGLGVVQAIGLLPGGTVTIQSVSITRIGTAAQAFNVNAQGLPVVRQTPVAFDVSDAPATFRLNYPSHPFTEFYSFNSANLRDWSTSSTFYLGDVPPGILDVTSEAGGQNRHFFKMVEADYLPVPASLNGSTLELSVTSADPDQTLTMIFTTEPRAAADFDNPLGTFSIVTPGMPDLTGRVGAYTWNQELHRGRLAVILEGVGTFIFNPKIQPDGSGPFTGYPSGTDPNGPFPLFGTFTSAVTP